MTEINTTSITDLPTDPMNGGNVGGNVQMNVNEIVEKVNNEPKTSLTLDQSTISQMVNALQQANISGATALPSRDIPQTTEQLTQDPNIQPNYIPPPALKDYINDTDEDIIGSYHRQEKIENNLDAVYDELQSPLLLGILYFVFQLPFLKKKSANISRFYVIMMGIII